MKVIDLRSDTVTVPDREMRAAMAGAAVGDDVYGEDPTVRQLEEKAADLVGKEAALFVPSGTMGNQVALLAHTERGDEVILDEEAHIYYYEAGSPAMLAGVQLKPVAGLLSERGPEVLRRAFRPPDIHFPPTRLVCLENTFNRGGGTVMPPEVMREIFALARERGLAVHLDGARIFNAAVALGCDVREFTRYCDSVMFCLSKGLGAPVGSLLAGSREFIARARRYRKALGGGMRQAGVLAAAGLVALKNIPRLAEDHANARLLAEALAGMPGMSVDLRTVQTNIVVARLTGGWPAPAFAERLAQEGVRCHAIGPNAVRFVTHRDVSRADIEAAIAIIGKVLAGAA
ncbi:low-specificity L-threonine aldolase [Desulfovirgula thermocuniculi]|uniref:low-specificity L-threonine aldolase n=1 Tax=Desulfovirgula thermocuniculi TaxID=348842 RepID=UPI0003FC3693|nr:low-specificity L-threonine aldolase [Desulfovirgula thermocuniculi]